MIAVDTNLLYAHRQHSQFFDRAATALRTLAETPEHWAIPSPCIHEFLSVVTNPRIFNHPTPIELESPCLKLIGESETYWRSLAQILVHGNIVGPKVHDARIAAICQTHGIRELWSSDRDFRRMHGVKVTNPVLHRD